LRLLAAEWADASDRFHRLLCREWGEAVLADRSGAATNDGGR
jgi:hypothetical protein